MAASTKTMQRIVETGYRRLGLLQRTETLNAADAANGLEMLNSMMHNWRNLGVDTSHTDKALSDLFPLDAKYDEGVACMLAAKLAGENGDQLDPQHVSSGNECWKSLLAQYLDMADSAEFDATITNLPSQRHLLGV